MQDIQLVSVFFKMALYYRNDLLAVLASNPFLSFKSLRLPIMDCIVSGCIQPAQSITIT